MKQLSTIQQLKNFFLLFKEIQFALLYGSFGRNEGNPNSDIDIQIFVGDNFNAQEMITALQKAFENKLLYITEVNLRNKIVAYLTSQPKIEFAICRNLEEINRDYLASEIIDVKNTILFANEYWKEKIENYLHQILQKNNVEKTVKRQEKQVLELIDKFIYEFENCSTMHRRSDAYKFYFFYNIALHVAIQLKHLSAGETKSNFLPKYFVANTLTADERSQFYELKGTLYLPEANIQKRKLLDFFYSSIQSLVSSEKQSEIKQFLEWIYERDFFWNFRDTSTHNPKIKSGIIYRSATMSLFQNENLFEELLNKNQIKTIIDLRADREIEESPYNQNTLSKINYVKAPFDPWNQPNWFVEKYHFGTNEEIAYRFFALACKEQIKKAMLAIAAEKYATAIHCFAGKDRTGILISMLHLLTDVPIEIIYNDYLASEADVKPHRLEIVLNIIKEKGGIVPYLIECGLQNEQIEQLKSKLLNGN
ncbi:MAG: hypothetical protein OHK0038_24410 [Flammeovirgaceae bacterium]